MLNNILKVRVPTCYLSYIVNGDDSIFVLSDDLTEKKRVDDWINSLPIGGHFSFSDEEYFSYSNDINKFGSTIVDGEYIY